MLVGAIPAYRLPREVLQQEIDVAAQREHRAQATTRRSAATSPSTSLLDDGYKAVYVAIGSHQSKKLGPARRGRRRASSPASSSSRPTTCTARSWPRAASASSAAATRAHGRRARGLPPEGRRRA